MNIKNYLLASRIPYASASVFPVIFAAIWCAKVEQKTDFIAFVLSILGVLFCHLGANTFNDYYDWDESDKINQFPSMFNGGCRKAFEGIFSRKDFLNMSLVYAALCMIILVTLLLLGKIWLIPIVIISGAIAALYSYKPVSLQAKGVGEVGIFLAFGPMITLGTGYAITGQLTLMHFLIGIPQGILTCAIIWINEFPDFPADKEANKNNLVVRLGLQQSVIGYILLQAFYIISIFVLIFSKVLPIYSLVALLIAPLAIVSILKLQQIYREPLKVNKIQANTVIMQGLASILLIGSMIFVK